MQCLRLHTAAIVTSLVQLFHVEICCIQRLSPKELSTEVNIDLVQNIIEHLTSGPLAESDLSVFLDNTVSSMDDVNSLVKSFKKPISLLSANNNTLDEVDETIQKNSVLFLLNVSLTSSVILNPSLQLEAKSVIAINLDTEVQPISFFKTPLFAKSKASTVLHPIVGTSRTSSIFKVYQDVGFDSQGKRAQQISFWDTETFKTFDSLFEERWNSLGGAVLEVASDYDDKPLIFSKDDGKVVGLSLKVLNAISKIMNFTYVTQLRASDGEWGSLEDGTWNGMLGEIYRREKNLTVNYFTVTYERANDFDYSASFYTEGFGFVLKNPPPLPRWMSLIYPFTHNSWIGIAISVLSVSALYYFYRLLNGQQDRNLLVISFILILKPLLKQSTSEMKDSNTIHSILAVTWWLTSFIIGISYTCNFIAVLTVAKFPPKVQLTKELADSDYRVIMMDYGEFVPEALKTSKDSILKELGAKLDLIPQITTIEHYNYGKARDLVMNATHAQIETLSYLKLLFATSFGLINEVYFMSEQVYYGNLAFFFPLRTPWKHKFDQIIPRLVESGIVIKWYNEIMEQEMGSVREQQKELTPALTLDHFQGAFYIWGICLGLSIIIFMVEKSLPPKKMKV